VLLFWRLLSDTLKEWGFKINEYDLCVANKYINGQRCTIIWHLDDLKISHVDKYVVKFGKDIPLTTMHNKVLEYLIMTLDYLTKGKVKVSMIEYSKKLHSESPSDMNGSAKNTATAHLFNVN